MAKHVKPLTLFDEPWAMPKGFAYYPAFIDASQEAELLAVINQTDLHAMHFQGYTAKRKVTSFGYDFDFTTRKLLKGKPVPGSLLWVIDKVAVQMNTANDNIAEVLITEYPPGSVINWHRDAPLSIASPDFHWAVTRCLKCGLMKKWAVPKNRRCHFYWSHDHCTLLKEQ